MKIPLSYNIRNLAVRRTTTLMTALGIGLTVAVLASAMALKRLLSYRVHSVTIGYPNEIRRLTQDWVGDGWQVVRYDVATNQTPVEVKR